MAVKKRVVSDTPSSSEPTGSGNPFIAGYVRARNSNHTIRLSDRDLFVDAKGWIPLSIPQLQFNLGVLGMPYGLIEIAGESRGGKTSLMYDAIKNFQYQHGENGFVLILSSEKRDNKLLAQRMGVNTENVLVIKIRYVEQITFEVDQFFKYVVDKWKDEYREGRPHFFIGWDSVGSTISRSELDTLKENSERYAKLLDDGTSDEDWHKALESANAKPGAFAKAGKELGKFLQDIAERHHVTVVMINHLIHKIGGRIPNQKMSTGGTWLEYMPTLRIRMKEVQPIKDKDNLQIGQISEVAVEKNDFGSRRSTRVEIQLGWGFVLNEDDIAYALEKGLLVKGTNSNGTVSSRKIQTPDGLVTWSARSELYALYRENPMLMDRLTRKINKLRHEDVFAERRGEKVNNQNSAEDED